MSVVTGLFIAFMLRSLLSEVKSGLWITEPGFDKNSPVTASIRIEEGRLPLADVNSAYGWYQPPLEMRSPATFTDRFPFLVAHRRCDLNGNVHLLCLVKIP
jgi:hypothetical protein